MRQKTLLFFSVFLSASLFGQNVYIPDANFKDYLVGNSAINTNNDNEIQVSEANSFDGQILIFEQYISDLTGLEAFTSLTKLILQDNSIFNIDVSQNIALERLVCADNFLTSLDVSQNTALTELYCNENQLTSLDVSINNSLTFLSCFSNQITKIDVSQNTNLEGLSVSNNQLICLKMANGNNINIANFEAFLNPNLSCIEVDDVNYSTINWTDIDTQHYYSNNCNNDCSFISSNSELNNTPKQLIKIVDVLGRDIPFKPNTPLIYVYDDGSIEKVFSVVY